MGKKKGPISPAKALKEMLTNMSQEEIDSLMDMMDKMFQPGEYEKMANERFFVDNRKDYASMRKPVGDILLPLYQARHSAEVLEAYRAALPLMEALTPQQREDEARNFLLNLLADAPQRITDKESSCLFLYGLLAIMEKLDITGLADELIEMLRQDMYFFSFFINGYEDVMTLALSKLCRRSLPQLKSFMIEKGRIPEMKFLVLDAVTHRAETHPEARLEVVSFLSSLLGEWLKILVYPVNAERLIYNLARLRATETLPLIQKAYQQIELSGLFVEGGYKGVQGLMKTGCEAIELINQDTVEQMLVSVADYEANHPGDDEDIFPFFGYDEDEEECPWLTDTERVKNYHLTVTLKDAPIPVTRELMVPSTMEMTTFEDVLAMVMGWKRSHLSWFIKGKERYMSQMYADGSEMDGVEIMDGMSLEEFLLRKGSSIKWEYDFGDSWMHEIKVKDVTPLKVHDVFEVRLTAAENACPPEDCGGVWGYAHLLEVLADKKHPEYKDMKQWVGRGFNPHKFNMATVQKQIDKYLKTFY